LFTPLRFGKACDEKGVEKLEGMVIIQDMGGLGWKHMESRIINFLTQEIPSGEAHYPELLKSLYVVNAPRIFPALYKLLTPFIDEATRSKIHIHGSDLLEELQKDIPIENIPAFLGGKCKCEKGCCPSGGIFSDSTSKIR